MDRENKLEEEPPRLIMKKTEKSLTEEISRLVNTVSITRKAEDIGQE